MTKEELSQVVLKVVGKAMRPVRFREIEAFVVLEGVDVTTYEVQRAVSELRDKGDLTQEDDFRYTIGNVAAK